MSVKPTKDFSTAILSEQSLNSHLIENYQPSATAQAETAKPSLNVQLIEDYCQSPSSEPVTSKNVTISLDAYLSQNYYMTANIESLRKKALNEYLRSSARIARNRELNKEINKINDPKERQAAQSKADEQMDTFLDIHVKFEERLFSLYSGKEKELVKILEKIVLPKNSKEINQTPSYYFF